MIASKQSQSLEDAGQNFTLPEEAAAAIPLHAGHRERLRARFLAGGADAIGGAGGGCGRIRGGREEAARIGNFASLRRSGHAAPFVETP